tara:strand:- start:723 stop:980 length:258 start_codon:yes stop_codon:yes gene_type:complete
MEKFKLWCHNAYTWFLSWFEDHQYLYVSHNQYNSDGDVIDVLEKKFEVRKFYKISAKHMKFKQMNGRKVELRTATPMDYMLEEMD